MIWGEVVNAVRSLHLEMMEQFQIQPKLFQTDFELESSKRLVFPNSTGDFEEWEWITLPDAIQEALELHSVERALVEGPLMPIEQVKIQNQDEMNALYDSVLRLEKEWLEQARISSPDKILFIEQSLKIKWLKLQGRAGLNRLKAV